MHDKIKELAEKADLLGPTSRVGNSHEATERFAQLIIKECAESIIHNDKINWLTAAFAAKQMAGKFGVNL